jgi:hypothetical protein
VKHFQICVAAAFWGLTSVGCSSVSTPETGKAACQAYCNQCPDAGLPTTVPPNPNPPPPSYTLSCPAMCDAMAANLPVGCNSATVDWFNCLAAQKDKCARGCTAQETQAHNLCLQ